MTITEWSAAAAEWGYPLMTGVCAMWIFICLMQWWGRRRWLDVLLAGFFSLAMTAFLLLSMATGRKPLVDYTLAVALVRILWLSSALVSMLYTTAFVIRRWRRWRKWLHQETETNGSNGGHE